MRREIHLDANGRVFVFLSWEAAICQRCAAEGFPVLVTQLASMPIQIRPVASASFPMPLQCCRCVRVAPQTFAALLLFPVAFQRLGACRSHTCRIASHRLPLSSSCWREHRQSFVCDASRGFPLPPSSSGSRRTEFVAELSPPGAIVRYQFKPVLGTVFYVIRCIFYLKKQIVLMKKTTKS